MVKSGFMETSSGATRHLPQRGKAFCFIAPAGLYPNGIINLIPISIVLDKQDAEQRKIQAGAVFFAKQPLLV